MAYFYFSRISEPPMWGGSNLVAGTIKADSLADAQKALDETFREKGLDETHESFQFVDLDSIQPNPNGLVTITTRN